MLARKGDLRVPVAETSHSLATPLTMATTLLTVLINPKVRDSSRPFSPSRRAWKSVTIQLSKTLNSRLVPRPPSTRPAKSKGRLGMVVSRHDRA